MKKKDKLGYDTEKEYVSEENAIEEAKKVYRKMMNDRGKLLGYALAQFIGAFVTEMLICLFLTTSKRGVIHTGIIGAVSAGTLYGIFREKLRLSVSLQANTGFFLTVGLFVYLLATAITAFLFGVQL